jgi:hypothetical protein
VAPPKGNKFWVRRTKHGREAIFTDPAVLWAAACEYFTFCEDNPLNSVEFNGKDATECIVPKMRAFTLAGLCLYLGVHSKYFNEFKVRLSGKRQIPHKEKFIETIAQIEETIYVQKFEGAAAGLLAGNLISRELGLADKQAIEANVKNKVDGKQVIEVRYERKNRNKPE